jgi:hypothetical protein
MTTLEKATPARPADAQSAWPALPLAAWRETYDTLHMWTQIVGKIRLELSPPLNHWWATTLYVTPHGLSTSAIPHGTRTFEITIDFINHTLWIAVSDGQMRAMGLYPRSVANFYHELMAILRALDLEVRINPMPQEVANPIRCDEDDVHAAYDAAYAHRFWQALVQSDRVLKRFQARFVGKSSPVHFFWGSFDLAVTRFSGRRAPERPGADHITSEAYSHEVISCGWWPGTPDGPVAEPAYYAYAAPAPAGLESAAIRPPAATYSKELGEFVLPYDAVRTAADPDAMLLDFAQSTYEAAATLGGWDRAALER